MYHYKLIVIASFALALPSIAEVEVNPTYSGEIGLSTTSKMTVFQGTISDLGVDFSQVGTNLQVDFTKEITINDVFIQGEVFSEVLSPSDTPYKHVYPDANKVILAEKSCLSNGFMFLLKIP